MTVRLTFDTAPPYLSVRAGTELGRGASLPAYVNERLDEIGDRQ